MALPILGLGTAVPEHTLSQQEAIDLAAAICCENERQVRTMETVIRKSGVLKRHTATPHTLAFNWKDGESDQPNYGPTTHERMEKYEELAPPLAAAAAGRALQDARLAPAEITHLVTVTCTGFFAPSLDVQLIHDLGLPPTTERVQVGFMGCHGAINGMRVAQAIGAADASARVLLCAVELCSLHYRFHWDWQRMMGNVLFGDGAAALVCGAGSDGLPWRIAATGSCLLPDSAGAMSWRIGDHGFEMTLDASVPERIIEHLRPWLVQWLDSCGLDLPEVRSWAIHPGGPRIVEAAAEGLGLLSEATAVSHEILANYGNMSSPTILFILDRLRRRNAPGPCVALGFGPGLVAEAALLE